MRIVLVVVAAAIAAPTRYLIDRLIQSRHTSNFPAGTLVVNLIASLVLGLVASTVTSPDLLVFLGTGFCGTLSTYSTFSFETVRLVELRAGWLAISNVILTLTLGLACVYLGGFIGDSI